MNSNSSLQIHTIGAEPNQVTSTVMAFYAAFDRGGIDQFDEVGSGFKAKVFGDTTLDWADFIAFGQAFCHAFPNGRHLFDCVITEGDCVATVGRYQGRHEREFMGVPPTGREVDFAVFHVDRVKDGLLIEHRGIGDANTMWAQLGVPAPTLSSFDHIFPESAR